MTIFNLTEEQTLLILVVAVIAVWHILNTVVRNAVNKARARKILAQGRDLKSIKPEKLYYVMEVALESDDLHLGLAKTVWEVFNSERRAEGLPGIYRDISDIGRLIEREGDVSFITSQEVDFLIERKQWKFLKVIQKHGYEFDEAQSKTLDSCITYSPAELLKLNRSRLSVLA